MEFLFQNSVCCSTCKLVLWSSCSLCWILLMQTLLRPKPFFIATFSFWVPCVPILWSFARLLCRLLCLLFKKNLFERLAFSWEILILWQKSCSLRRPDIFVFPRQQVPFLFYQYFANSFEIVTLLLSWVALGMNSSSFWVSSYRGAQEVFNKLMSVVCL